MIVEVPLAIPRRISVSPQGGGNVETSEPGGLLRPHRPLGNFKKRERLRGKKRTPGFAPALASTFGGEDKSQVRWKHGRETLLEGE